MNERFFIELAVKAGFDFGRDWQVLGQNEDSLKTYTELIMGEIENRLPGNITELIEMNREKLKQDAKQLGIKYNGNVNTTDKKGNGMKAEKYKIQSVAGGMFHVLVEKRGLFSTKWVPLRDEARPTKQQLGPAYHPYEFKTAEEAEKFVAHLSDEPKLLYYPPGNRSEDREFIPVGTICKQHVTEKGKGKLIRFYPLSEAGENRVTVYAKAEPESKNVQARIKSRAMMEKAVPLVCSLSLWSGWNVNEATEAAAELERMAVSYLNTVDTRSSHELMCYLRVTAKVKASIPSWQPLLAASIASLKARGINVDALFVGLTNENT